MRYLTAFVFLLATTVVSAFTSLSYQGQLQDGSGPVDDTVAMSFTLFDAKTGGSQVGETIHQAEVNVVNGLFRVSLDFGEQPYANRLWLAIKVEGEPLSPRQAITGAPFAISTVPDDPPDDPPDCPVDDPPSEDCEDYCEAMTIGCSGTYSDEQQCLDACACFPTDGEPGDTSGDTLQCRGTWLQMGFEDEVDPATACANAADDSPECVD